MDVFKELELVVADRTYVSKFNYEEFGLEEVKNELLVSEKRIVGNIEAIGKYTFEIAEQLYLVNRLLAKQGSGIYMNWCESVGINKDRSSLLLKRYNLYLETKKKEVMELPVKIIKELTHKDNEFTTNDVVTIVEDEKPSEKFKQTKDSYSHRANIKEVEIVNKNCINKVEEKMTKESLIEKKQELARKRDEMNAELEKIIVELFDIEDLIDRF